MGETCCRLKFEIHTHTHTQTHAQTHTRAHTHTHKLLFQERNTLRREMSERQKGCYRERRVEFERKKDSVLKGEITYKHCKRERGGGRGEKVKGRGKRRLKEKGTERERMCV